MKKFVRLCSKCGCKMVVMFNAFKEKEFWTCTNRTCNKTEEFIISGEKNEAKNK